MFQPRLDQGAVLLKQAVTPLVEMVRFADIRISPEDLTLVSVSNYPMFPQVFIALRMRSLMFAQFRCNETRWICINLRHLFSALALARSEDSIEIHCDEGEDVVGFLFNNPRTRRVRYSEMALIEVYPADQMQAGFANFKYQVIVGIPSVEFQRQLIRLRCFGETVYARITDTEVRLSVANEEVLLTNENCIIGGDVSEEDPVTAVFSLHCLRAILKASHLTSTLEQCIIGGAVSEDPVSLVFSLWHVQAMVHASAVSDRVWLLGQSNGLHVMLNCPVGENGNRMFYFG